MRRAVGWSEAVAHLEAHGGRSGPGDRGASFRLLGAWYWVVGVPQEEGVERGSVWRYLWTLTWRVGLVVIAFFIVSQLPSRY